MSERLFDRRYEFRFGPAGGEGKSFVGGPGGGLELSFEVSKSLKKSANKAKVTVHNLTDKSIGELEEKGTVIQLLAGYKDNMALLFTGQIAKKGVVSTWDGKTITTEISAGDGELDLAKTRSDISLAAGTTSADVLRALISKMGIGEGNVGELPTKTYLGAFVHSGWAKDAIARVCRDIGVSWSIQDGVFQALAPSAAKTGEEAVLLSASTGLIGAPTREKEGIQAVSLMQPRLKPGGLVRVESRWVTGDYKITEVAHKGTFRSGDWYSEIKGRPRA
jgi:hypothetical protein